MISSERAVGDHLHRRQVIAGLWHLGDTFKRLVIMVGVLGGGRRRQFAQAQNDRGLRHEVIPRRNSSGPSPSLDSHGPEIP